MTEAAGRDVAYVCVGRCQVDVAARHAAHLRRENTNLRFHLVTDRVKRTASRWATQHLVSTMPSDAISMHANLTQQCQASTCATNLAGAFLYKPLLHKLLHKLRRVLVLDTDTVLLSNATEVLWQQFDRFSRDAVLGVARAQSPIYARSLGAAGTNGGVQLLDLERMRRSDLYAKALLDCVHQQCLRKSGNARLGDQTLYSSLQAGRWAPLVHVLPCGCNRQLSVYFWHDRRFRQMNACNEACWVVHGNQPSFKGLVASLLTAGRAPTCAECLEAARAPPNATMRSSVRYALQELASCCCPRTEPRRRLQQALPPPQEPASAALRFGCIEPGVCLPPNVTIVFIGDSLTRYQYLDLVFTLHFGSRDFEHRAQRNPLTALSFATWLAFMNHTTSELHPCEACDCYRAGRSVTFRPDKICENRLYRYAEADADAHGRHTATESGSSSLQVAFFNVFGSSPVSGHLPKSGNLWQWHPAAPVLSAATWNQSLWRHAKLEGLLDTVVARLQPSVIVLNAGLHPVDGLDLEAVRRSAAGIAPCIVYKTTTPARPDVDTPAHRQRVAAFEAKARRTFAHDILLDSTALLERSGKLNRSDSFVDAYHFRPASGIYHVLNVGLVRELERRQCQGQGWQEKPWLANRRECK